MYFLVSNKRLGPLINFEYIFYSVFHVKKMYINENSANSTRLSKSSRLLGP